MGVVRGGELDFEGLSCDAAGNRYLVSEAQVAVLKLPVEGSPAWLPMPANLIGQARVSGLFWQFNGLVEGLAVNPAGTRLWLAAERQNRGLLALQQQTSGWACGQSCVLLSESAYQRAPAQMGGERLPLDFADLAFLPANCSPWSGCNCRSAGAIRRMARWSAAGRLPTRR